MKNANKGQKLLSKNGDTAKKTNTTNKRNNYIKCKET